MEYENIKRLIDDMGESKLTALEIDFPDGMKISMKKGMTNDNTTNNNIQTENNKNANNLNNQIFSQTKEENLEVNAIKESILKTNVIEEKDTSENYKYITSPMVGTFYSKPSPTEKCFVEVGDNIKKGATTCIIEAMKLMNEIETEFEGEVVEVLKKDGEPVEYGEKLIKLR